MCTYRTDTLPLTGSAKGAGGWAETRQATVYFDHPVHAPATHTLNVDVWTANRTRIAALELDAMSARALAATILTLLDDAERDGLVPADPNIRPRGHSGQPPDPQSVAEPLSTGA